MAGFSNGASSPNNYYLGRGCVQFATLNADDCPGAWREVGNVCTFNLTAATEVIEHFSCKTAVRTKDQELISQIEYNVSIELDEFSLENLGEFLLSTPDSITTPSVDGSSTAIPGVMGVEQYDLVTLAGVSPLGGRYYDVYLVDTDNDGTRDRIAIGQGGATGDCEYGNRAYGLVEADFTIAGLTAGAGTFSYDPDKGQIFVPFFATTDAGYAGSLLAQLDIVSQTATPTVAVSYANTAAAGGVRVAQLLGATRQQSTVAVRFYSLNQANAEEEGEWTFHKVTIRPNGDLPLINEADYGSLTIEGTLSSVGSGVDGSGNGFFTHRDLRDV